MGEEEDSLTSGGDLLLEFSLPVTLHGFVSSFLEDSGSFYEKYLAKCLGDIEIRVGEWGEGEYSWRRRIVESKHPPKIKFPGLAKYAQSKKTQEYCFVEDSPTRMILKELTSFVGIPYADYFSVALNWYIHPNADNEKCSIQIRLDVIFHKNTWLKSQVKANTRSELMEACTAWQHFAQDWLELQQLRPSEPGSSATMLLPPPALARHRLGSSSAAVRHRMDSSGMREKKDSDMFAVNIGPPSQPDSSDDDEFYECQPLMGGEYDEEQALVLLALESRATGMDTRSAFYDEPEDVDLFDRRGSRRIPLIYHYVESFIVVVEWVGWQFSFFNFRQLRRHFTPSLDQALGNLVDATLPGRGIQGGNTDLYIPLMLMFSLTQVFLLCMDVTNHTCPRETLLGNSLAVSFNVWVGTSCFYFAISYLLAAHITFLQSLAATGYGLFGWCLALLSAHLSWHAGLGRVGEELILLVFGGPAAINLAVVFWREQPSPSPEGSFYNRLFILLPKVTIFAVVAGTHYQFLRYLYNDFLQGNKELCVISSVLNPQDFANILTQKQLREMAGGLIKEAT